MKNQPVQCFEICFESSCLGPFEKPKRFDATSEDSAISMFAKYVKENNIEVTDILSIKQISSVQLKQEHEEALKHQRLNKSFHEKLNNA